jgi:hypothetical protein
MNTTSTPSSQNSSSSESADDPTLAEYRRHLVAAEQKSQEDFDKTVLSLSGGALGISFIFLKDVLGNKPILDKNYLLISWVSWGLSSIAVLASFYFSHLALRRAIDQVDKGTIKNQRPGGCLSIATDILNASGAILFFIGVLLITLFASSNLTTVGEKDVREKTTATTPSLTAAPETSPKRQGNTSP